MGDDPPASMANLIKPLAEAKPTHDDSQTREIEPTPFQFRHLTRRVTSTLQAYRVDPRAHRVKRLRQSARDSCLRAWEADLEEKGGDRSSEMSTHGSNVVEVWPQLLQIKSERSTPGSSRKTNTSNQQGIASDSLKLDSVFV